MYEKLSAFAQVWGTGLIVGIFVLVLVYALWPGNRKKFSAAARQPLEDAPPAAADSDPRSGETQS